MTRLLWCSLAIVGCTDARGPRLESVSPEAAPRTTRVTITGERLCGTSGNCDTAGGEFQIGLGLPAIHANVIALDDDSATLEIPEIAEVGATEIVLTVNERSSNALAFEVLP
ncbi:MAG: hypothetical protein H0V17_25880 [Deltaproteobacteria bacterium]|nr:hypothetical protein [Deltaproteobacteria bacterium]